MASEYHLKVSAVVKSIHKSLREETEQIGANLAWQQHCLNTERLDEYSNAMRTLALLWEENSKDEPQNCRVRWVHQICCDYFSKNGVLYQRTREKTISKANHLNFNFENDIENEYGSIKLNLLDVGSCYNPYKQFNCYEVTAVDLAPANEDVYKCDFLNVVITKNPNNEINKNTITHLTECSFHIVVFSLLLEYIPTPELRLQCCKNAYDLLKDEGILLIITPDSKHVGANAQLMKSWQFVLAKLGFSRFKYEKLKYIHCMAFRKCIDSNVAKRWADIYKNKIVYDKIYIPQDVIKHNTIQ